MQVTDFLVHLDLNGARTMIEEVRRFVSLFDDNRGEVVTLRSLAEILEKLGCIYYEMSPAVFQPDAKDPPDKDMVYQLAPLSLAASRVLDFMLGAIRVRKFQSQWWATPSMI